jgi:hypothetical protein
MHFLSFVESIMLTPYLEEYIGLYIFVYFFLVFWAQNGQIGQLQEIA